MDTDGMWISGTRRRRTYCLPPTDVLVWHRLMSRKPDAVRFRRQAVVGPHLVDLYCPAAKIVADLDAPAVGTESDAYLTRIAEIEKAGVRVLRFRGASVISAIDETCDAIIAECVKRLERSNSSQ